MLSLFKLLKYRLLFLCSSCSSSDFLRFRLFNFVQRRYFLMRYRLWTKSSGMLSEFRLPVMGTSNYLMLMLGQDFISGGICLGAIIVN
jgi:hypothetical protein